MNVELGAKRHHQETVIHHQETVIHYNHHIFYYGNRNIVVVVVVFVFLVCVHTSSAVDQLLKCFNEIMEFDGEGVGSPTKVKESLLNRYQLHKNEHQQVFVIDNGISIAILKAIRYAFNLYTQYTL